MIKCEGDHDNDIGHELQLTEPFSDHLDYLDHFDELNDVQLNNHGPMEQFQINALQSSNLGDPILNNNLNKVIQRVEVIHHDGDSVTKYETTSHTDHEESDELFDDPLISSLQSSTTPNAYTKIVKKTVFNRNGGKNFLESIQPVEITYSNNKLKEVEIDNSMSKPQYMSQIDSMKNIEMSASSQQFTDLPDNLKNTVPTKVANISASDGKSNDLNEPIERKYNVDLIPSNNIKFSTSSSNSNFSGGITGSLQSRPIEKDGNTNIISKTEIIGKNRSKGRPLKRISRKLGNSSNGKKIITKYQGNKNDGSDSNEYELAYNTEQIRSSNNIIPTTSSSNSNYNGGITGSLQSYPVGEDGKIKKKYTTEIIDNTGSNSKPIQKIPRKRGRSFKGKKTVITKYQGYNNDDNDFEEYDKNLNTDKIRSINNQISTTSSSNSNHNGGITSSLQSYPMGNDDKIKTISTIEIIDNNGSNIKPTQKVSRKRGNSFKGKKTIITKYQDYENDGTDLDEFDIDHDTENAKFSTTKITKNNRSNGNRRHMTTLKPGSSHKGEKELIIKYQGIDDGYSDLDEHDLYDIDHNIEIMRSSNNILSPTSSLNSNYYNSATGSLQSDPMGKDGEINTISTTEIIDKNSSNGLPIQRISHKPINSFNDKKTIITKYQGDDNDFSGLDEHSIDINIENTRSSNNIVSKLNPSGYNKIITTTSTTTDRDNTSNNLLESNTIPNMNYDLTYSSPQLNQGVSNNLVSSGQLQTEIIKQEGSSDESNNIDSNGNYNKAERIAFQNSNTNSNNMISSFDNNNANYVSYNMRPLGASMSGKYKSSMKTNGNSENGKGLRKKKSKSSRENKVQGGSSKQMRSKNKSYTIINGNGRNRGLQRNTRENSRSAKQLSSTQSNRSNFKTNLPKSTSFSKSYSRSSPIQHGTKQSCSCNSERKLSKRQSSESNENNYLKDIYDSESLSVKHNIVMDNLPMHNNDEKMIGFSPTFGAFHEISDLPSLTPPLSLLKQVSSSPLPPPL